MIDSLISRMPFSDTSVLPDDRRSLISAKRTGTESVVPQCKKHKKSHKWSKKSRSREGKSKCKSKKGMRTKPEAPFNSTQFIMGEHDNFNDSDLSNLRPRRQRDSSLSMESEDPDEEAYCSPEEEFITQQFWSAYEEFHAERLDAMSKGQLVQEYFVLEDKLNLLERELKTAREHDRRKIREPSPIDDEDEEEIPPGEIRVDAETAAKIEVFRSEIEKLEIENSRLKSENSTLRRKSCRRCLALANLGSGTVSRDQSSSSSISSSSEDSSSSSESDSDSNDRNYLPKQGGGDYSLQNDLCDSDGTVTPRPCARLSQRLSTVDFISDSGIASSSSGDDFKVDRKEKKSKVEEKKNFVSNQESGCKSCTTDLTEGHGVEICSGFSKTNKASAP